LGSETDPSRDGRPSKSGPAKCNGDSLMGIVDALVATIGEEAANDIANVV